MTSDVLDTAVRRRVLFACVPAAGHVTPLLPLARALARCGCEVAVASGPDVATTVIEAGLGFKPVGPGMADWFAALAARTPGPPGAGLAPEHVERYFIPRLFGEIGVTAMRDDLDALVGDWDPDLLVFEPHALAAPLIARRHTVPAVQHAIGLRWQPLVAALAADAVAPAWAAAGLPVPPSAGLDSGPTLAIYPPVIDPAPPDIDVRSLRTTPLPDPARALPIALPREDRPLVLVTLGTSFNEAAAFTTILAALEDLPVTVLATLGHDHSADELGPVPANAVIAGFVPQEAVLPHCAAAVHHGGAGTALGVLAHGLPSVVVPRGADNFAVAARMAAADAAQVVGPEAFSHAAVRDAVRTVLGSEDIRAGAGRVARAIAAMPGPDAVASLLLQSLPVRKAAR